MKKKHFNKWPHQQFRGMGGTLCGGETGETGRHVQQTTTTTLRRQHRQHRQRSSMFPLR